MEIRQATRQRAKLRLALAALGGGGKTYTALLVASILSILMREVLGRRARICGIDTEHESMELYSMTDEQREHFATLSDLDALKFLTRKDADAFDFNVLPLDDHSPRKYVEALGYVASQGYDIVIVDSLSHAWAGKNGALEQKDNVAARGGNSYTAWRDITPMHNALVEAMLSWPGHLIATLRQKMDYVQEKDASGKTVIRQVGLASIQREGMEYEFTIFGDMEKDTNSMRVSKHRLPGVLNIGDVFEKPGEMFTRKLWGWLMSGAAKRQQISAPVQCPAPAAAPTAPVEHWSPPTDPASRADLEAMIPDLRKLPDPSDHLEQARAWYNRQSERLTAAAAAQPAGAVS